MPEWRRSFCFRAQGRLHFRAAYAKVLADEGHRFWRAVTWELHMDGARVPGLGMQGADGSIASSRLNFGIQKKGLTET